MNEPAHIIVHIVVHVVIFGRVQGVGYRAFVAREAGRHRLEGWVRNCRDGTVEALFKGEAEVIDDMIAVCRRGPSGARVDAALKTAFEKLFGATAEPAEKAADIAAAR
jgi:acylphosphatase